MGEKSDQKHTPGPWDLQELPLGNDGEQEPTFRITGESTLFLDVSPCADGFVFGQNEANARLIAAAPELLVVAEYVLDMLSQPVGSETLGERIGAMGGYRAAKLLVDAILKATGKEATHGN